MADDFVCNVDLLRTIRFVVFLDFFSPVDTVRLLFFDDDAVVVRREELADDFLLLPCFDEFVTALDVTFSAELLFDPRRLLLLQV